MGFTPIDDYADTVQQSADISPRGVITLYYTYVFFISQRLSTKYSPHIKHQVVAVERVEIPDVLRHSHDQPYPDIRGHIVVLVMFHPADGVERLTVVPDGQADLYHPLEQNGHPI